ncbi:hypothetical protein RND71_007747 [Anisodus tanguticus]|uniref:Uncharacterized protein n=1 Tax=Anisodus tanguticus TaxID=243964 RepID=A0AAE1SMW5_9SOLA|nr:hypothetical protein RND71_007747 [Anisodus tanguticus]
MHEETQAFIAVELATSSIYHDFINVLLLHPRKLRSKLQSQGIKGPSPYFLYGNLPDIKKIQLQKQERPDTNNQELEENNPLLHTWPSRNFKHLPIMREMVSPMVESTSKMIELWDEKTRNSKEYWRLRWKMISRVCRRDIISRACFGSGLCSGETNLPKTSNPSKGYVQGSHWSSWIEVNDIVANLELCLAAKCRGRKKV